MRGGHYFQKVYDKEKMKTEIKYTHTTLSGNISGVLLGLLQIAFVVLKLTDCIDWAWGWVLLPTIIIAVVGVVVGIIIWGIR